MFHHRTPRRSAAYIWLSALLAGAALHLLSPARAWAQPVSGAPAPAPGAQAASNFKPDTSFLKEEPGRKTKQVVRLSGVKSEAELTIVREAMNDIIMFVRLFGITGSNLGHATIPGVPPERLAQIKAAEVTWRAFERASTPKGRQSMPLEPASGHMAWAIDEWVVESDGKLSVRTDFRQTMVEQQLVKNPTPRVYRLHFVKQDGKWLFDGATP